MKSVHIRRFSGPYFPIFSPNTGKYGPEKLWTRTLFTKCEWVSRGLFLKDRLKYFKKRRQINKIQCINNSDWNQRTVDQDNIYDKSFQKLEYKLLYYNWNFWFYHLLQVPFYGVFRSSHQRCSIKKGVFKNFAKFTCKHLCRSIFFNEVEGLRPATLLKKFCKFSKIFKNTAGKLLLHIPWLIYSQCTFASLRFQLKHVWGIPYQNAKNHKTLSRGYNSDNTSDLVTESIVSRLYV